MLTEGKVLEDFIRNKRGSITAIAKALGITRQTIYQYFESVSLDPETKQKFESHFKQPIFTNGESYIERRRLHKLEQKEGIPIYEDAPYTLTNTESFREQYLDKPDFWITIPGLRKCNYGCRATGDSMHPLIRTHALVVGEEITDISFILFGEIYIIQTRNGLETVKYIHPHEKDPEKFLLVPFNEKARTTPINKDDILKLYRAKAVFNVL